MKIAVIGTGGVGGYYGGLLAQQGHAVTCVAGALDVKNYTRGLEGQISQRSKSSQRAMPANSSRKMFLRR